MAERLKKINPSSTLAITSKAKKLKSEGCNVLSFAAGEPDFNTPDFINLAAIEAIKDGFTKYTPTTGIPDLKKLISEKFKKDNTLDYSPNQIVVSCGAKHSIFNTLMATVGSGDDVLIPSPYWVSYPEMVNLCEANPRFIPSSPKNNFKITVKDLEKYANPRTKMLIINSPSNPTGCVYTLEELKEIAEFCVAKKIMVISDEIYEKIIFDSLKHVSIASLSSDIYDLTITVNGLSKSHAMTGWRIGYLGAPQDIAEAVAKLQDHSTSNPSSISQKAAVGALRASEDFSDRMRLEFQKRRDYIVNRLSKIKEISYVRPQGAFYIFCDISWTKLDSVTFANRLLDEACIAVIPGDAFGNGAYVRLSFATSLQDIEEGIDRLEDWLKRL